MRALLDQSTDQLKGTLQQMGEPAYRAKQVEQWLMKGIPFEEMRNLPKALQEKLQEQTSEGYARIAQKRESADGTVKYLLALEDGNTVETVFLPNDYGNTLCVSTQVGCAMGCKFCASTTGGLVRNLTAGEMLSEVIAVNKDRGGGRQVDRIVLMGMGEPLANYDNVVTFLRRVINPDGLGIGQRNISLSTCGVVVGMDKLAEEDLQLTLAVSLHSPFQDEREKLMPSARKYELSRILDAAKRYFDRTGRRVTFEYALIAGVNDRKEDLNELVRLLKPLHTHVNIIPLNASGALEAPTKSACHAFAAKLTNAGVPATVRRSMGGDIEGACGQLRRRALEEQSTQPA